MDILKIVNRVYMMYAIYYSFDKCYFIKFDRCFAWHFNNVDMLLYVYDWLQIP